MVEATRGPAGIDLVFRPLPAPLLAEVRLAGTSVIDAGDVRKLTRLRDRDPLWPARLEGASRDLALDLVERGYLEAQVEGSALRHVATADAVFEVRSGPLVRVGRAVVEGTGAPRSLRDRIRPRPGQVFRRPEAAEAADRMRKDLLAAARWRARVEVQETYDPGAGRMGLVFRVTPGPRMRVEVRARLSDRLRRALEARLREGALASDALEQGRELLEDDFRRRGHREVVVSTVRRRDRTRPRDLRRGPGALVPRALGGGEGFPDLVPLLHTRPGAPVQDRVVEEDARTLARTLEDRGYAGQGGGRGPRG